MSDDQREDEGRMAMVAYVVVSSMVLAGVLAAWVVLR